MTQVKNIIVPVQLKAQVVNEQVRKFQNMRKFRYNFQNLQTFTSPEPQPFGGGITDFSKNEQYQGIYVSWQLPAALRHGNQHRTTGNIEFPVVPNRWLVVRYSGPVNKRAATAWVIESDFLDPAKGTSNFIDPGIPYDPQHPVAARTLIGKSTPLNNPQWKETATHKLFLTALGPGDVFFSAYQPLMQNVFSFQDPLTGIVKDDNISYMVAGWYSDSKEDILNNWTTPDDFKALMTNLNWEIANNTGDDSHSTLYQGFCFNVQWDLNGPNPLQQPTQGVFVSIGNTTADALTALIAKQHQDHPEAGSIDPRIIEAFQYNMLNYLEERNGMEKLEQKIHEAWFGSLPGGTVWEVVDNPDNTDNTKLTPDYFKAEASALAQLNTSQLAYETALFGLQRMQTELYGMWWKYYRATNMNFPPSTVPSPADIYSMIDSQVAGNLYNRVVQQINTVRAAAGRLPTITATDGPGIAQQIRDFARTLNIADKRQLKRGESRRFWQATDPVILINGASYDPPATINETLTVRTPAQLVTGLNYQPAPDGGSRPITLADVRSMLPALDVTNLPAGIQDLLNEFFFLDPFNAPLLATAIGSTDQTVINNIAAQIKSYAHTIGTPPAIIPGDWKQPWEPLFMEWKVAWYPIPYQQANYLWQFDGKDYEWSGNGNITANPYTLSGRTFLTPQAKISFRARLEQFLTDFQNQDLSNLTNFINSVDKWDLISQTLSGFSAQLRKTDPLSNVAPTGDIAALIQEGYATVPDPASVLPFDGVRAGQFVIKQLKLFDAFGQALEIVEDIPGAGGTASDNFRPILSEGLTPVHFAEQKNTFRFIQLMPRLLQPLRLNFDFLDANNDDLTIDLNSGVNPVCAWLLPNHLDQGLMAYTPAGSALGELRVTIDVTNRAVLNFWPSPYSPVNSIADLVRDFPNLGYMFQELHNQGPEVFRDFMNVIDSTLWTTDPLGSRHDEYLSVLIGRPLALVRCQLQFQLYGSPIRDTAWEKTFDTGAPDFINDRFYLRLGNQELRNDGLIGYFIGKAADAYQGGFNAVHDLKELQIPETDTYIHQIGPGNFLQQDLTGKNKILLSMLIDPRAAVHVQTGIISITTLSLPDHFLQDAMNAMEVTFRSGPVLTEATGAAQTSMSGDGIAAAIRYLQPAENRQNWSWIEKAAAGVANAWNSYRIEGVDDTARLAPIANTIRDGWMKLTLQNTKNE